MKKSDGTTAIKSIKQPRACMEGSYHPLDISLKKFASAEQLDNDPLDYIVRIESGIRCLARDREDGPTIGEISAQLVEVDRASRMGQPLFDVFDSDGETFAFFEPFIGRYANFHSALRHYLGPGAGSGNLLLLTLIALEPRHRSKGLGLRATHLSSNSFATFAGW